MHDMTSALLEYWPCPPPCGWTADDLDRLPPEGPNGEADFFDRVELIDGSLVFNAPQTCFHSRILDDLAVLLNAQRPEHLVAVTRMDVKLGHRMRPCPDVLVIDVVAARDLNRTFYRPEEVRLAVEVVSPESEDRDRKAKPPRYAEAGIPHFWRVEEDAGRPVVYVYVYELDSATRAYALTGIHHGRLTVPVPFAIDVALDELPL